MNPMDEPQPNEPKFDLVCKECSAVLFSGLMESSKKLIQQGYCNRAACKGKLEWRPS